jgi:hypothetical protein
VVQLAAAANPFFEIKSSSGIGPTARFAFTEVFTRSLGGARDVGVDPDLVLQQLPVPLTTHRMQFFPADYFNSSQLKCESRAARALTASKRKHRPACPPVIKLCRFGLAHSQLYCCSTRMLAARVWSSGAGVALP